MNETVAQISRFCWKLAQWQDSLPVHLKIITSRETANVSPRTLETIRFRILLSLRFLGTKILVLRPVLSQFLDLTSTTAANEQQSKWFCSSGAVLLANLVSTCRDVLHISKSILIASRNDQNILGAWWFSCYYSMNVPLSKPLLSKVYLANTMKHSIRHLQSWAFSSSNGYQCTLPNSRICLSRSYGPF